VSGLRFLGVLILNKKAFGGDLDLCGDIAFSFAI